MGNPRATGNLYIHEGVPELETPTTVVAETTGERDN